MSKYSVVCVHIMHVCICVYVYMCVCLCNVCLLPVGKVTTYIGDGSGGGGGGGTCPSRILEEGAQGGTVSQEHRILSITTCYIFAV